ncbi:hypothetical protein UUU_23450 [Klebsiella pneumoniae subsp. pneumoniae DSM 30104 = JCM 1662 = NBRC 14940]|nr:hypothetical protein UUU_23450 [Klebsiella pneumoniae subsp. pneumoniae DSM 30104 = JCM 1662 = NBRC 14940]
MNSDALLTQQLTRYRNVFHLPHLYYLYRVLDMRLDQTYVPQIYHQ